MGLFNFFKKKKREDVLPVVEHTLPPDYEWTQGAMGEPGALPPGEPMHPLAGLQPPQERPQSLSSADMQTLLTKLDLITERLGSINQRLEALERALQTQVVPPPGAHPQAQQQTAPLQRW